MIDALVNRIKDAYFDLERDSARRGRFATMTQAFTPGAIIPPPSTVPQMAPNTPLGPQPNMGAPMPEMGTEAPAPAPQPSILEMLGASR